MRYSPVCRSQPSPRSPAIAWVAGWNSPSPPTSGSPIPQRFSGFLIDIGILPSSGGLTRIGRTVGASRARDLVLRGRRFDARQAEQWGIVSEIACVGEHVKHATETAHELAGQSPVALRVTKRVLDASLDSPRDTALLLEQLAYAVLNETGYSDGLLSRTPR